MISQDNIFLNLSFKNKEELFKYMNEIFLERKYVNDDFLNGIIDRENKYPTGICFEKYNVAIPHTDTKYILKENIVFIRLNEEIQFKDMVTSEILKTNLVIILLVKNAINQTTYLMNLMEILGEYEKYRFLSITNDKKEIEKIFNK